MYRFKLQVFIGLHASCVVASSLEVLAGSRQFPSWVQGSEQPSQATGPPGTELPSQATGTQTAGSISSSVVSTVDVKSAEATVMKDEEKKSIEMFHSLLRRESAETLHQELDSAVLAEFAKAEVLNRVLQSVSAALQPGSTQDFLRSLHLCEPCQSYEKIANRSAMCTDGLQGGLVSALSYGIDGDDHWGMAVASKYNIPLHEYDCNNRRPPEVCSGCTVTFHNECIVSARGFAPGAHYKSMGQQLMDLNLVNAPERSLLLRIDVDMGMEWNILAEEPTQFLRKFRQIVVAFHRTNLVQNHELYLHTSRNLEAAGFSVAHLHGNGVGLHSYGEYSLPIDIEVTYVPSSGQGCITEQQQHSNMQMPMPGMPQQQPQQRLNMQMNGMRRQAMQMPISKEAMQPDTMRPMPPRQPAIRAEPQPWGSGPAMKIGESGSNHGIMSPFPTEYVNQPNGFSGYGN